MKFTDGVEFDTSGDLRVEYRHDGAYVVGNGLLIPVKYKEEGDKIIKRLIEGAP